MSGEASTITNTLESSETTSGKHIHHDSVESAAMSPSSDPSCWPAFADAVNRRPALKAPRKSMATTAVLSMSGEASTITNTLASSETTSGQHIRHDSVESAAMSPSSDPSGRPASADAVNRRPTLKAPRKSMATTAVVLMSGEASTITNTLASSETTSGQHIHHDSVESVSMSPSSDPSRWPAFSDAVNRRPTLKAPRKSMATSAVVSMSGEASTITNTLASSQPSLTQDFGGTSAAMSPSSDPSRWPEFAHVLNKREQLPFKPSVPPKVHDAVQASLALSGEVVHCKQQHRHGSTVPVETMISHAIRPPSSASAAPPNPPSKMFCGTDPFPIAGGESLRIDSGLWATATPSQTPMPTLRP